MAAREVFFFPEALKQYQVFFAVAFNQAFANGPA